MSFTKSSEKVYSDLKAHTDLVNLLSRGEDSINPLIASENEADVFINYFVEDNGSETKDALKRWVVVVHSYANDYEACCEIADQVSTALEKATSMYKCLGGKPIQSEEGWLLIEQKFNIKI